ncbi:PI31 proteasome regulator N-terminal-domain-containing protein [Multifurca ochricompacta]|uniref:PI31 proteasome regulator N-terminal-domain-containing protein n=1 Tax=Multifurca ochricompacta TaxID=376703 RepID=A0AAD4MAV7_9AGAM|nr:PI31 proteasome regulator N-terminal-domain-containing protein [Multifurca ochricompacta]
MAPDLLDPSALTSSIPDILPSNKNRLESQQDAIAALVHTAFNALSFRLIAVDDSAPASTALKGMLPESWNIHGPWNYTLRYRHEQSSLEFIVKIVKLGGRTLINAIALESDKAASLDISTNDFTSPSFFPYDAKAMNPPPLIYGFISSNRVTDFISQLKLKIIQSLMPGLHKEGYSEGSDSPQSSSSSRRDPVVNNPARPQPLPPPYAPVRPFDEPSHIPFNNPLEIGRRDLDPLGVNPLGGFGPPRYFLIRARRRGDFPSGRGPWGGDGFLPPMGAPPGARFDPVGPSPRGGLPGGGNFRGPDNDEFMPPGAVSALPCYCCICLLMKLTREICSCEIKDVML